MSENIREFGVTGTDIERPAIEADTLFDELRAELSTDVEAEPKSYVVPNRPNMEIIFGTDIDFDLLKTWLKRASRKNNDFDPLKFAYMVMSFKCTGIIYKGQKMTDDEGTPLTFAHAELQGLMKVHDTTNAIRKVYGNDGHIISTAQKVIEDAGFSDFDIEEGSSPLSMH